MNNCRNSLYIVHAVKCLHVASMACVSAQISFGFTWNISIHALSLTMTSDEEVLLHGVAVKCDVAPFKNPKVLSSILADP